MRRKSIGETSGNSLTMDKKGRQKERGKSLGKHGNYRKGISKSRIRKIECYNCGKKGHSKKDCRAPKKQRDGQREKNQETNVTCDVLQYPFIFYLDNTTECWVVYLGASFQATSHRKYFQDYVQGDFGHVYLGDDEPCQIVRTGKLKIKKKNGNQWLLKEVRHILDLRRNIFQ
jgi:hypothetical protein